MALGGRTQPTSAGFSGGRLLFPAHSWAKPRVAAVAIGADADLARGRQRLRIFVLQDFDQLLAHEAADRAGQERGEVAERRVFNGF